MRQADLFIKINKSNFIDNSMAPITPLEQTLKTPLLAPKNGLSNLSGTPIGSSGFFNAQMNDSVEELINLDEIEKSSMYIQRSDSIISSISDLPNQNFNNNYTLQFTNKFDEIILNFYNKYIENPTITPFNGLLPPSGLMTKIIKIFLNILINKNYTHLDTNNFINFELLVNNYFQPILLKLFKKRLTELIKFNANGEELPMTTTILLNNNEPNLRNCSISNLSLSRSNSNTNTNNLRKQSLTRNNSFGNSLAQNNQYQNQSQSNWLHIGNLNNTRNFSTDSLQSNQDFVPQYLINRTNQHALNYTAQQNLSSNYLETPPQSTKNSIDSVNSIQLSNFEMEIDEFNFNQSSIMTPPQTIRKNANNLNLSLGSMPNSTLGGLSMPPTVQTQGNQGSLDSPFMSTFNEEFNFKNDDDNIKFRDVFHEDVDPLSQMSTTNQKKRESLKLKRGIH